MQVAELQFISQKMTTKISSPCWRMLISVRLHLNVFERGNCCLAFRNAKYINFVNSFLYFPKNTNGNSSYSQTDSDYWTSRHPNLPRILNDTVFHWSLIFGFVAQFKQKVSWSEYLVDKAFFRLKLLAD